MDEVYVSHTKWSESSDHTLAIYCSDPRFREAFQNFLIHKGLRRYDRIVVPGGCKQILSKSSPLRSQIRLLDKLHKFQKVIVIAHYECGFYKNQYPEKQNREIQEKETHDLHKFASLIQSMLPEVAVETYFAKQRDQKIAFFALSLS